MRANRSIPSATVIPVLAYADLGAAVTWLCDTFGFTERLRIPGHRVQLHVPNGGAMVAIQGDESVRPGSAHSIMVRVESVDAHHARAAQAGATIVRPPQSHAYGERQYTVRDVGGHTWTFTESVDDVTPESWGGVTVAGQPT
jgi:uncharacterized glyoxalase superfamily protein PhnB